LLYGLAHSIGFHSVSLPEFLSPKPSGGLQEFGAQLRVTCPYTAGLGIHHNIELAWNFAERFSKDFSEQALNAIPYHCAADFSRYRQT
jgi:hypothetical protein